MTNDEWPLHKRFAGHLFMLALGPVLLTGEFVDPMGNVHWQQLIYGILGTWVWALGAASVWRVIA